MACVHRILDEVQVENEPKNLINLNEEIQLIQYVKNLFFSNLTYLFYLNRILKVYHQHLLYVKLFRIIQQVLVHINLITIHRLIMISKVILLN